MRRVTLYLLEEVVEPDDALDPEKPNSVLEVAANGNLEGRFYYSRSHPKPPPWVRWVTPFLESEPTGVSTASASGLLVVKRSGRFFAVTFGYGRSLLNFTKVVRQFGLRATLNRVDPGQIRSMDTKTFEDMVVTRNTQTSKSSDLPSFGVDILRDILRAVTGEPRDRSYVRAMSGSDALVVSLAKDLTDLHELLDFSLTAFEDTAYKSDFDWIDQMSIVPSGSVHERLDSLLVEQLAAGDTSRTHMAMPEPLDWQDIDAFQISGTRKREYPDLDLDLYLSSHDPSDLTVKRLKERRVAIRYARGGGFLPTWTVYQCLVSEQRENGQLYVLIEGRWFEISETLVERVDDFVSALPRSSIGLTDAMPGETEPEFNERMSRSVSGRVLKLDAKIKRPGSASSGIEFCDLLGSNGELVHVKRKSRSSTLSHLFAQGLISATALVDDGIYRDAVRDTIREVAEPAELASWLGLVPDSASSVRQARYTISYVVLANSSASGTDWLPFFSRLNLMQQGRQLRNMGYNVAITRLNN